jgi:chemotaxis response regulator CheB
LFPSCFTDFRPRALTAHFRLQEGDLPRVLLVCTENVLCERLRQAFQSHTEFEIHGGVKNGADMLAKATEVRPDLVVLQMASNLPAGLDTAEKLKRTLPHVPLFLFRSLVGHTQGSLPFLQGSEL